MTSTTNGIATKTFLTDDFLLQTETARILYHEFAKNMPIIDYHNHLPPNEIVADRQFENISKIWLYGDHYKWRAMRTQGINERFITGDASDVEKFEKWAETVPYTMRNPLYHWTHLELSRYFDENRLLKAETAHSIYDTTSAKLNTPQYSVQNLLKKMNVEVVCTTDDPLDTLEFHQQFKGEKAGFKMLPAFRPDKFILIDNPSFATFVEKLGTIVGFELKNLDDILKALRQRADFFATLGCQLCDHGLEQLYAEDFFYAGGLPAVINEMKDHLHKKAITVNGKSLVENSENAKNWNEEVIAKAQKPILTEGGIAVVKGNICENGAVIKPSAASEHLMKHKGRAVVFETIEDYHARIDDPNLDIDETCVMVLKNVGPKGYPGMPEVGNMALPKKLLEKGITDMVRISDARMSGTAYGTVFLHASPESAIGGNLGLVQNGDMIEVDVHKRYIHLHVSDEELIARRKNWKPIDLGYKRGYVKMYINNVTQSHEGADFDFLQGGSGDKVNRESH